MLRERQVTVIQVCLCFGLGYWVTGWKHVIIEIFTVSHIIYIWPNISTRLVFALQMYKAADSFAQTQVPDADTDAVIQPCFYQMLKKGYE